ncbi:MAG: RsmE family RNA methyltransferase [Gemmataceae bacterium]
MADRFFTPQPLGPGSIELEGDEAKHLAAVRRFGVGDRVFLFNGDGREYPALVSNVAKRNVTLQVESALEPRRERPDPLTVAAAIPKGDRCDFLIEKLVELGVGSLIPLITERSIVIPKPEKAEKWERAVIEASKQCGRNVLMKIEPPLAWDALMNRPQLPASRFVLHTGPDLPALTPTRGEVIIAIGPEGGLTPREVDLARESGWQPRSLGPRVLRMETAAIAAAVRIESI